MLDVARKIARDAATEANKSAPGESVDAQAIREQAQWLVEYANGEFRSFVESEARRRPPTEVERRRQLGEEGWNTVESLMSQAEELCKQRKYDEATTNTQRRAADRAVNDRAGVDEDCD